jgi:hypothetical protein
MWARVGLRYRQIPGPEPVGPSCLRKPAIERRFTLAPCQRRVSASWPHRPHGFGFWVLGFTWCCGRSPTGVGFQRANIAPPQRLSGTCVVGLNHTGRSAERSPQIPPKRLPPKFVARKAGTAAARTRVRVKSSGLGSEGAPSRWLARRQQPSGRSTVRPDGTEAAPGR